MTILWKYLQPHRLNIILSLSLAAIAQLLNLVDPIIFGKIIDDYATDISSRNQEETIREVTLWLLLALAIALAARLARAFQDYTMRKVVAGFGMQIFNDGLRQTLRLSFQEFEESRSGETL